MSEDVFDHVDEQTETFFARLWLTLEKCHMLNAKNSVDLFHFYLSGIHYYKCFVFFCHMSSYLTTFLMVLRMERNDPADDYEYGKCFKIRYDIWLERQIKVNKVPRPLDQSVPPGVHLGSCSCPKPSLQWTPSARAGSIAWWLPKGSRPSQHQPTCWDQLF